MAQRRSTSVTRDPRAEIHARLEARRPEIEQAVLTRVYAISESSREADPEYAEGLRRAVSAAIDYGLAAIETAEEHMPPVPTPLLMQARIAARNGVSLDTVLRRYFAGYSLLGDFLIEEASGEGLAKGPTLKRLLRVQATLFDRLLTVVSEEHAREVGSRPASSEQRRAECAQRLLDGELCDSSELAYDLDAFHLGLIARGPEAAQAIRALTGSLDHRLLLVRRDPEVVWAWLGRREPLDPGELLAGVASGWPAQISLAIGEPGEGLAGWRLTHRQAKAALTIAERGSQRAIRYADVALLSSIVQDDVLTASLRAIFLEPLERGRDGGEVARETLSAYFAAERNISSAASALGISRQAVAKRIRSVEEELNRTVGSCGIELEAALRLEDPNPGWRFATPTGIAAPHRHHSGD